jgi:hypothetical protein
LKLILVGVRQGERVLNWPHLVLAGILLPSLVFGAALVSYRLFGAGQPLFPLLIFPAALIAGGAIGSNIRNNMIRPIELLPVIN